MNENIELVFDEILETYPILTEIDCALEEYVQNIIIYKSLNLTIPLKETSYIFQMNQKIMQLYIALAEADYYNKNTFSIITQIKVYLDKLKNEINEADNKMLNKIKMCCAYFNSLYLTDEEEYFANSSWSIALFSNNEKQLLSLSYDKIQYLCDFADEEMNIEDEEILNSFIGEEIEEIENEGYESYDEITFFLTHYLIYLNKYIINNNNNIPKGILENLLAKKYLLLSLPELSNTEDYYLDNYTIDNLEAPTIPKSYFTEDSFQILLTKITECALSLDYSDKDIYKNPYLYTKIIINSLFIKTYLNLSINEEARKEIMYMIINTRYYKNDEYKIATQIIDNIIFTEDLKLNL